MLHSSVQQEHSSQHGINTNNNNQQHTTTTTSMTSANSTNLNANAEGTKTSTHASVEIRSLAATQLEQQHNGQKSHKRQKTDNDNLTSGVERTRTNSSIHNATRARLRETSTSTGSTNSNIMHSNEETGNETRHRRCGSSSSGGGGGGEASCNGSRRQRKTSSSSAKASTGNVGSTVATTLSSKTPYQSAVISSNQQQTPTTAVNATCTTTAPSQRNLQQQQQQQQSHQNSNTLKNRSSTTNLKKNARERSDDERLSIANDDSTEETTRHRRRRSRRLSKHTATNSSSSSSSSSNSSSASSTGSSCNGSCSSDDGESSTSSGEPNLAYPGFPEVALRYLTQDTRPRNWCLMLITNPWFERISILVILLNCITLGMYQPCVDDACEFNRCKILQIFDDIIFVFFALEMSIKMVAMGIYGKNTYLADSWNRLDFFIVFAGFFEYVVHVKNLNLTAIRTIRVLRPLRAINRIPSMRILVMLLLDTLPMLGNVLLLCFFVFFIFGIIGVQLWNGILRQRCVLELPEYVRAPANISFHYEFSKEQDYICSTPDDSGMHMCTDLPPYRVGPMICTEKAIPMADNSPTNTSCVNWNRYYSKCKQQGSNPFQGTISFDNIGMAWVAIFLVISLEGWTDIMYYVQDAHSFWDWIYFVLLIVIGSFFMINLCLVVIATQFSETKKREMERMRQERARYTSTSTLASSTNNSEPATCYAEIVKYIAHLWRRFKRRMLKKYRLYKYAGCSFNFIFLFFSILFRLVSPLI